MGKANYAALYVLLPCWYKSETCQLKPLVYKVKSIQRLHVFAKFDISYIDQ